MKILKSFALALLSLILLISLSIFGLAYTVNQVALNSHYMVKTLKDINFADALQEAINQDNTNGDISPQLESALVDTLRKTEPVIMGRIGIAIDDTYVYLKGQGSVPSLQDILGKSVMNSQFVADLLDEIDISQLADQALTNELGTQAGFSDSFRAALIAAIDKSEPDLKKQIVNVSDPIFKYLLMQSLNLDLKSTLRQTVLSNSMVSEILSNFDTTTITKDILTGYLGDSLPQNIHLTSAQIDRVGVSLQPAVKTTLTAAAGNFADYLTGASTNFTLKVPLASAGPTLKTVVKEAFTAQLPAGLQGASQSDINNAFEQYYTDFVQTIPATYDVSTSEWGIGTGGQIVDAINNAQTSLTDGRNSIDSASQDFEKGLQDAKPYVNDFRAGFTGLIVLILLVTLGIISIYRNVKNACLNLGIIFALYGASELVGVIILRSIANAQIANADIPQAFSGITGTLLNDGLAPLQTISIVSLVLGVLLIAAAIVYPSMMQKEAE